MATRAKAKKRKQVKAVKLPLVTDQQLEAWLTGLDLELFAQQMTKRKGLKLLCTELNCRCTALKFAGAVEKHCRWWCRRRVRPENHGRSLDGNQWDQQLAAVRRLRAELSGKPLHQAVMILRTEVSTSERIMRGLPRSLRIWEE